MCDAFVVESLFFWCSGIARKIRFETHSQKVTSSEDHAMATLWWNAFVVWLFLRDWHSTENAKLICNRQKFHLWVYHRYKTCRNAQTLKVSINGLPMKDLQMRVFFKNSTSNLFLNAILVHQKIWWNVIDEIRALLLNKLSFFYVTKNIFVLFLHTGNVFNHPLETYPSINFIFYQMLFSINSNLSENGNLKWRTYIF